MCVRYALHVMSECPDVILVGLGIQTVVYTCTRGRRQFFLQGPDDGKQGSHSLTWRQTVLH